MPNTTHCTHAPLLDPVSTCSSNILQHCCAPSRGSKKGPHSFLWAGPECHHLLSLNLSSSHCWCRTSPIVNK